MSAATGLPEHFADFVRSLGIEPTPAQEVFWSVACGDVQIADLSEWARPLARDMFGDVDEVPESARGVIACIKGADVGFSFFAGLRLLHRAVTGDMGDASQGVPRVALAAAPDLKLARQMVRTARAYAEQDPRIAPMILSPAADSITFDRGDGLVSSVEVLAASAGGRATRGRRYLEVVLDEAAFFRTGDASYEVNDQDVFQSVEARCIGQIWLGSTPWLAENLIWKTYERNFGRPVDALAARLPTLLVRTEERTRRMVEAVRARDPDRAAQEYDCELPGIGGERFFASVDRSVDRELVPRVALEPSWSATVGIDLGQVRDSTAAVAVHRSREGELVIADVLELRPKRGAPLPLRQIMPEVCGFAESHGQRVLWADHHLLTEARQHLPAGFTLKPVMSGNEQKVRRYARARELFQAGNVRIPAAFARLVAQLGVVVAKPQPGGGTSIVHPRVGGSHGDVAAAAVIALALSAKPGNAIVEALKRAQHSGGLERMSAGGLHYGPPKRLGR